MLRVIQNLPWATGLRTVFGGKGEPRLCLEVGFLSNCRLMLGLSLPSGIHCVTPGYLATAGQNALSGAKIQSMEQAWKTNEVRDIRSGVGFCSKGNLV